ncbi:sensor histidine kinase [Flammeovirga kamogawensis]|uniref:histidine kinase n=1 Tax=Flammeovirga kamogawensis TaxID=373891 RepID=A0ABX8GS13_9BACT|nr:PAS domain-containing protein [Flammeovirga kamogawensis]MBB6461477.1 PAS domain S-box-containing protein [Flammeovirga kamogawensis]QWG06369.1 PAS domain-containing protein [Flammeovirga kamogawensis]TRX68198.1 PAS domain S-box protein [Flammeovirga kamogawensis]
MQTHRFLYQVLYSILLTLGITTIHAFAQSLNPNVPVHEYEIKTWTKIQDTPIDRVFSIKQDTSGYLWIGSDRGLLKFDGAVVEVFNLSTDPIIESESIKSVEFDKNNRLWFATNRGLFYLRDNKVVQLYNEKGEKLGKTLSMFTDKEGVLWFTSKWKVYSFENDQLIQHKYPNQSLFRIFPSEEDGQLLALHTDIKKQQSEIYKWNIKTNETKKITKAPLDLLAFTIKESKGKLLIGGQWGELCHYNPSTAQLTYWLGKNKSKQFLRDILVQEDGTVWAGGEGLHRVYNNKVETIYDTDGLTYYKISTIFLDRDGNLWAGSTAGLNYLSNTPFSEIPKSKETKNVRFCEPTVINDQVVFGSDNNGVFTFNGKEIIKLHSSPFLGSVIYKTAKSNNGNLLLSTNKGGFEVKIENDQLKLIKKIWTGKTTGLFQLSNGKYIINNKEGFYITNKDTLIRLKSPFSKIESLSKTMGDNWLTTSVGVYLIEDDTLRLFNKHLSLTKYIVDVTIDYDSSLWVGTYGSGLVHIKNRDEVIHYDTRSNLPANQAMLIAMSKPQGKWFFVTHKRQPYMQEIIPTVKDGQHVMNLGKKFKWNFAEGAFHEIGYNPYFIKLHSQLYLLTKDNLYTFKPKKVHYSPPKVVLQEVVANNVKIDGFPTTFPADLKQIEFHLSTLDFTQDDNINYEFKIEGYDKEWLKMGNRTIAYYNALPTGNYTFNARIRNANSTYTYLRNPYSFNKKEYWYKTTFAQIIYIIFLGAFIYALFQWRLRIVKIQRKNLQIKVDERTRELKYLNDNLEELVENRTQKISLLNHDLTQSKERLNYALEATKDGIWDYNVINDQLVLSEGAAQLLGYTLKDCNKQTGIFPFIHTDDKQRWVSIYEEPRHQKKIDEFDDHEFRFFHKNGQLVWILVKCKIVERTKTGNPQRIVGTYIDVTEKKRKTQEILEAILRTEDNERQRISKDIHDGLQQTLTISSLNFQSVIKNIDQFPIPLKEKFETGWNYLQNSISESRSVAHSLMPKAIVDFGIISAFESLILEVDKSSETIEFTFFHNFKDPKIENPQIEITLYRILQEGINNIFKYSKASKVDIQLKSYDEIFMLTIEDNGVGFDASKILKANTGLGFKGMKNRLDAIDGFLEIESREGRGTTLLIEINKNF